MLRKKENFVTITPIPSHIPRQLAIDLLHSHSEVITVNPLVTGHKAIKAPQNAPTDEYYATWYEITERLKLVPGIGKLGTSKISFNACFHDMPWGLQTHTYAPAGVDMRNNWRICGNQPGEPVEARELGIGAPAEGLYMREDIEIKCNMTMVGFVKSEMKKASKVMVERMVKKAEMLDAGQLQGMFEDGRLTTLNPADRTNHPALLDQRQSYLSPKSPVGSVYGRPASTSFSSQYNQPVGQQQLAPPQPIVMELPGDMYHAGPPASPNYQPGTPHSPGSFGRPASVAGSNRWSTYSTGAEQGQQYTQGPGGQMAPVAPHPQYQYQHPGGYTTSPPLDDKAGFMSELPAMPENRSQTMGALKQLEATGQAPPPGDHPAYRGQASSGGSWSHAPDAAAGAPGPGKPHVVLP